MSHTQKLPNWLWAAESLRKLVIKAADTYTDPMKKTVRASALFIFLLCSGFGECYPPETAALLMGGYTMLSPPSNLFAPGAIVMMQEDANGRAQLKLVCGPRANLGAHWMPQVSDTMSSSLKMSRSQRVALEADAVDRFKARTAVEDVASVTVSYSNPRLLELAEQDVFENISNRTDACNEAIETRHNNGYRPTFVTSAYIADVEYVVTFKHDAQLSKSVKEQRMGRIAATLGGGHTELTEHTLRAVNLTLAVKADEYLMQVKRNGRMSEPPADPRHSLDVPFAEALSESDAPIVPPAGGWVSPIRSR